MTEARDPDGSQPRSIKLNAALSLAAQLTGAAFTACLVVVLARRLGTHGYGLYSLALGITSLVLLPSDFGVSNSVARFVAEHRGQPDRVEAVMADGLRLKFLGSFVVACVLGALAGPIASAYGIPGLAWPIRAFAISLFGQGVMLIGAVFTATGRNDLALRIAFIESSVEVTTSIGLVLAGAGATGAAFGRALGYTCAGVATIVLLVRALGPGILPRSLHFGVDAGRIGRYAGVLLIIDGAYSAFSRIDVLIIGAYLSAASVGIFSAALKLTVLLAYPGTAIAAGVAPRVARSRGGTPNVSAFAMGLRVSVIVQAAITAFILGWAGLIVRVALGTGYGESASVLRALAPYIFMSGFGALVSMSANYLGQAPRRVPIAIGTLLINLVLDLVLVPRIGVIAGAIGTDAATALYVPAQLLVCRTALGLDLRPAAATLGRTLLAGSAMTGVLLLFGDSLGRVWLTALGGVLGTIAFCVVLWVTREVDASELRAMLTAVPGARRLVSVRPLAGSSEPSA
jgi:O-antigen/teichoic acid export membrane protein